MSVQYHVTFKAKAAIRRLNIADAYISLHSCQLSQWIFCFHNNRTASFTRVLEQAVVRHRNNLPAVQTTAVVCHSLLFVIALVAYSASHACLQKTLRYI
jgi:hypothetical protein